MAEADTAARLVAHFEGVGATRIEPGYLQPADLLLDLYGEDIRARAYITHDPVQGEQMLRPDFTVPVVQMHMAERTSPARYTYAGPVWRKQDYGSTRAREFWQVGFEIFDGEDLAASDAEAFERIGGALDGAAAPLIGDLAILFASIGALRTSEARKAALLRHVWRPQRFDRLLARFAGSEPFDCDLRDLPQSCDGEAIGLRSAGEINARLEALRQERAAPDLSLEEVALIQSVLKCRGSMSAALSGLSAITRSFPDLAGVLANLERRMEAMAKRGLAPEGLSFDAALGRDAMEYYSGFVFTFGQIAQGGRYDALTRTLGKGADLPAVGGVIRPDLLDGALAA